MGGTRDVVYASTSCSMTPVSGLVDYNTVSNSDPLSDSDSLSDLGMTGEIEVIVPTGVTVDPDLGIPVMLVRAASGADDSIVGVAERAMQRSEVSC